MLGLGDLGLWTEPRDTAVLTAKSTEENTIL